MMNRVLFVGGGSGGHVIPNLAIIEALPPTVEVWYVGTKTGMESKLVPRRGIAYRGITAGKLRRYWSWENLVDGFRILWATVEAWWILGKFKPQVVFSKGGFVSVPVAWAAWWRRIPVITHESDAAAGLATRLIAKVARVVLTAFPLQITTPGEVKMVGIPVRSTLLTADPQSAREHFQLSDRPLLVVIGGSLGAQSLNEAIVALLPDILPRYQVVHLTGPGKITAYAHPDYHPVEYVDQELPALLAAATVVITRGGATVLFELSTLRKPMIIVPLETHSSRGEQILNAVAFQSALGVPVVRQQDGFVAQLKEVILSLKPETLRWGDYDSRLAAERVVAEIMRFIR